MAAEKNFFDDKNNFARDDFYHRKPYIDHFGSFSIERFEALSKQNTSNHKYPFAQLSSEQLLVFP